MAVCKGRSRTGTVVKEIPLKRRPSTLIWPPGGVWNSTLPTLPPVLPMMALSAPEM